MSRGPGLKCKSYKDLRKATSQYKSVTEDLLLHSPEEGCRDGSDLESTAESQSVGMLNFLKPISRSPVVVDTSSAAMLATYLKSSCTSPDNSSIENACTTKEIDQLYMDATDIMSENVHLRDLLLSHLDIIQQQSDTIIQRDRQMRVLRIENERLRQRLERMERRVRGEASPSPAASPRPAVAAAGGRTARAAVPLAASSAPPTNAVAPYVETTGKRSAEKRTAEAEKIFERGAPAQKMIKLEADVCRQMPAFSSTRFDLPYDNLTDEIFTESDENFSYCSAVAATPNYRSNGSLEGAVAPPKLPISGQLDRSDTGRFSGPPHLKVEKEHDEEDDDEEAMATAARNSGKSQKLSSRGEKLKKGRGARRPSQPSLPTPVSSSSQVEFEPLLTAYHYYVGCGNEVHNAEDKLTEISALQRGVEVPRWREDVHYTNKINLMKNKNKKSRNAESPGWSVVRPSSQSDFSDGAENTEDSHFLKRHEKREAAEKRTKKWDMQRARERCYNEKLKARYESRPGRKRNSEPDTLLPALESAERIRVSVDLPVSAFGETVPSLPTSQFSLPWLDADTAEPSSSDVVALTHITPATRRSRL